MQAVTARVLQYNAVWTVCVELKTLYSYILDYIDEELCGIKELYQIICKKKCLYYSRQFEYNWL